MGILRHSFRLRIVTLSVLVVVLLLSGFLAGGYHSGTIGRVFRSSLMIGTAEAAVPVDYVCDGVDDNEQFQAALNALSPSGGRITFDAGIYVFSSTVSRSIDNVVIEGTGWSSYVSYPEGTAFDGGSQSGWVFRNFRCGEDDIDVSMATRWTIESVLSGESYTGIRYSDDWEGENFGIPTGRSYTVTVASATSSDSVKAQADYVCDGVGDQTEINAAISEATLSSTKGSVLLMGPDFYISNKILVAGNLELAGWGARGATSIYLSNGANPTAMMGSELGLAISNISIRNLNLDGNNTQNTSGRGIDATGFNNFELTNTLIQNTPKTGLYCDGYAAISGNWYVANLYVASCGLAVSDDNSGLKVMHLLGSDWEYLTVDSCKYDNCDFYGNLNMEIRHIYLGVEAYGDPPRHTRMGIYDEASQDIRVLGGFIGNHDTYGIQLNSSCTDYTIGSGIWFLNNDVLDGNLSNVYVGGTCDRLNIANNFFYKDNHNSYGISLNQSGTSISITGNDFSMLTAGREITGTYPYRALVRDNSSYIHSGEIRVATGALDLAQVHATDYNIAWQNPETVTIIVVRVFIYLSTAGGTANSVLDVGTTTSAGVHSDNLIDGVNLNTTDIFDNITNKGTNGSTRQILDPNGGSYDWITGQIMVANAINLVGRYEIEYMAV